jgi:hypothetical protein
VNRPSQALGSGVPKPWAKPQSSVAAFIAVAQRSMAALSSWTLPTFSAAVSVSTHMGVTIKPALLAPRHSAFRFTGSVWSTSHSASARVSAARPAAE